MSQVPNSTTESESKIDTTQTSSETINPNKLNHGKGQKRERSDQSHLKSFVWFYFRKNADGTKVRCNKSEYSTEYDSSDFRNSGIYFSLRIFGIS